MIAPFVMNLTALEAFSDNDIWMIELPGILLTRHHADAVGEADALRSRCAGRSVFVHCGGPLPSIDFR
jgi:hypothetical protein